MNQVDNSVLNLYFPKLNIVKARVEDIQTLSLAKYLNIVSNVSTEDKQRQIVDFRLSKGNGVASGIWNTLTEKMMLGGNANESYCLLFELDVIGEMLHEGLVRTINPKDVIRILTQKYVEKYGNPTGEQTEWMSEIQSATNRCVAQIISEFPLAPWQLAIEPHRYMSSFINITIFDVGNNIELIKKAMSFFGYFLGTICRTDYVPVGNDIVVCKVLQFEPRFQEIITNKIKNS